MQQRSHAGRLSSSRRRRAASAARSSSTATTDTAAAATTVRGMRARSRLQAALVKAIALGDHEQTDMLISVLGDLYGDTRDEGVVPSLAASAAVPSTPPSASAAAANDDSGSMPNAPKRNARSYSAAAGVVNANPTQLFSPDVDAERRRRAKRARTNKATLAAGVGSAGASAGDGWIDPSAPMTAAEFAERCSRRRHQLKRCDSVTRNAGVRGTGTAAVAAASTDTTGATGKAATSVANTDTAVKRYQSQRKLQFPKANDVLAPSDDDDDTKNPHLISDSDDDEDRTVVPATVFDSAMGDDDSSDDSDFEASDSGGETSTVVSDDDEVTGPLATDSPPNSPLLITDTQESIGDSDCEDELAVDDDAVPSDPTSADDDELFGGPPAANKQTSLPTPDAVVTDFEFDVPERVVEMAKAATARVIRRRIATNGEWQARNHKLRWPHLPFLDMSHKSRYPAHSNVPHTTLLAMGDDGNVDDWRRAKNLAGVEPRKAIHLAQDAYAMRERRHQRDAETVRITIRSDESALCYDTYRAVGSDKNTDESAGGDSAPDKVNDTVEFDFAFPGLGHAHEDFSTKQMADNATKSALHIDRDNIDSFAFFWYTVYLGSKERVARVSTADDSLVEEAAVPGETIEHYMTESEIRLYYLLHCVEHVDINMVCSRMFKHYAYHPVFIAGMAMMMKWASSYNAQNYRLLCARDAPHLHTDPSRFRKPSYISGRVKVRSTGEEFRQSSLEFYEWERARNTNAWPVTVTCADWSALWMLKNLPYTTGTMSNVMADYVGAGSGGELKMSVNLAAATGESREIVDDSDFREPERKSFSRLAIARRDYTRECVSPFETHLTSDSDDKEDANLPACPLAALGKALALQGISDKTGTTDIEVSEIRGNIAFSETPDGAACTPRDYHWAMGAFPAYDFYRVAKRPLDYFSPLKGLRCAPQPMVYARQAVLDGFYNKAFGPPTIFTLFYPMDVAGRLFLPITFSRAHLAEVTKLKTIDEDALLQDIRRTRGEAAATQASASITSAATDAARKEIAQTLAKEQIAATLGSAPPKLSTTKKNK